MPYQAVESHRRYQQIAHQIERMIASGETPPGDRLPAERELAALFGVSRPTIREAMIALEIAGLVEIRTGSGIFVRGDVPQVPDSPLERAVEQVNGPGPFEVLTARIVIEPQVAAEAARKATIADIEEIRATAEDLTNCLDQRTTLELDQRFHVLVARSTQNVLLVSIVDELWNHNFTRMFAVMSSRTGLSETRSMDTADHAEILKQIHARNPTLARRAMRRHLTNVQRVLSKSRSLL